MQNQVQKRKENSGRFSLKKIMLEEVLPEQLSDELGEMLSFFIDLFKSINEWAARKENVQFKKELEQVGWGIIPFEIKSQIDKQEKFNIRNLFLNFDSKFKEQHKKLIKNVLSKRWRLPTVYESAEGKIISIKEKYPKSFCDQFNATVRNFGNFELYNAIIFNYASFNLKNFYQNIIIDKNNCIDDENFMKLADDTKEDLVKVELASAIEAVPPADYPFDLGAKKDLKEYNAFVQEIFKWFNETYNNLNSIEKIKLINTPRDKEKKGSATPFEEILIKKMNELAPSFNLPPNPIKKELYLKSPDEINAALRAANPAIPSRQPRQSTSPVDPAGDTISGTLETNPTMRGQQFNPSGPAAIREAGGNIQESIAKKFGLKNLSLKDSIEVEHD